MTFFSTYQITLERMVFELQWQFFTASELFDDLVELCEIVPSCLLQAL